MYIMENIDYERPYKVYLVYTLSMNLPSQNKSNVSEKTILFNVSVLDLMNWIVQNEFVLLMIGDWCEHVMN